MLTLEDTFSSLVNTVGSVSSAEFLKTCINLGMREQPYVDVGLDQNLPEYDSGHVFDYETDDNVTAKLEILEKNERIMQAGIQIVYPKSLFFSKMNKHYEKVIGLADTHYGSGVPMSLGEAELMNYGDSRTVCYISKARVNNRDALTLRVGNREFWR